MALHWQQEQSENQLHSAPRSQELLLCHASVLKKEVGIFKRHTDVAFGDMGWWLMLGEGWAG